MLVIWIWWVTEICNLEKPFLILPLLEKLGFRKSWLNLLNWLSLLSSSSISLWRISAWWTEQIQKPSVAFLGNGRSLSGGRFCRRPIRNCDQVTKCLPWITSVPVQLWVGMTIHNKTLSLSVGTFFYFAGNIGNFWRRFSSTFLCVGMIRVSAFSVDNCYRFLPVTWTISWTHWLGLW